MLYTCNPIYIYIYIYDYRRTEITITDLTLDPPYQSNDIGTLTTHHLNLKHTTRCPDSLYTDTHSTMAITLLRLTLLLLAVCSTFAEWGPQNGAYSDKPEPKQPTFRVAVFDQGVFTPPPPSANISRQEALEALAPTLRMFAAQAQVAAAQVRVSRVYVRVYMCVCMCLCMYRKCIMMVIRMVPRSRSGHFWISYRE